MSGVVNPQEIGEVIVRKIAMGRDSVPTRPEIITLIQRGKYYVEHEGSQGYRLVVFDDDDYKIAVTVGCDTEKDVEKAVVRGGKR
ncbi:hypothetical protein [Halorubrum ezzemoulense]|uniref:hypothetical protein n=1 Tax=Halorubrum ezzemoulense TaxID=337243 RepID=UPI0011408106|nr:hypothetical protein [Halorubrum ezzemoulense]